MLVIHPTYGLLVGEVKSVGDTFSGSPSLTTREEAAVVKRVAKAVRQLDKEEAVLKHLVSDLQHPPRVRKTLLLPNVTRAQLRSVLASRPALERVCDDGDDGDNDDDDDNYDDGDSDDDGGDGDDDGDVTMVMMMTMVAIVTTTMTMATVMTMVTMVVMVMTMVTVMTMVMMMTMVTVMTMTMVTMMTMVTVMTMMTKVTMVTHLL